MSNLSIKKSNLSWVVVNNLQDAIKFYTEVLGLKVNFESAEFGWAELSGVEGGAALGIAQYNDGMEFLQAGVNAIMTFDVDDLNLMKQSMIEKGTIMLGDVIEVPGHVKLQIFEDASGNKFQIVEQLNS